MSINIDTYSHEHHAFHCSAEDYSGRVRGSLATASDISRRCHVRMQREGRSDKARNVEYGSVHALARRAPE